MVSHQDGPVAQLGARFHGMEEVVGSNPTRSTIRMSYPVVSPVRPSVLSLTVRLYGGGRVALI